MQTVPPCNSKTASTALCEKPQSDEAANRKREHRAEQDPFTCANFSFIKLIDMAISLIISSETETLDYFLHGFSLYLLKGWGDFFELAIDCVRDRNAQVVST